MLVNCTIILEETAKVYCACVKLALLHAAETWDLMGKMELEEEGRRPVGRPKKTWSKVVKEDKRKLNITEDMAEDRKQWRQLILRPTVGVGN